MNIKILAFYLPQFYRVPENDEWWGEGFTEWTSVRGAEQLYKGHNQPRIPLNKNYYNLLEHNTMVWQAELMRKYRIDGMCIYHYWFENGKKILEKPIENLIKWTDVNMPFCFCWANETWSRTWKKLIETNVWLNADKPTKITNGNDILLKQTYGREKDWDEHFHYLLPFFKDNRYIKLNGKPIFVILKQSQIFQLWEMLNYFDKKAKENDIPGLYVIGMEDENLNGIDAISIRQPRNAMWQYQKKYKSDSQTLQVYPYDELCKIQLETEVKNNKTYLCGVVDYDSTPRMGKNGIILQNASPEKFYKYFRQLYKKSISLDNEILFINAWNEWGEGMYLEPDEKFGYGYLDSIYSVVSEFEYKSINKNNDLVKDVYTSNNKTQKNVYNRRKLLLENWEYLNKCNIDFSIYFKKYKYYNIAIYGMGEFGKRLYNQLNNGSINVSYGIDKNIKYDDYIIDIYKPIQQLPKVDAVVITVIGEYVEISELLRVKMECSIITLEEVIQELMFECEQL